MDLEFEPSTEESLILAMFDVVNHMTKNSETVALAGGLTVQQWLVLLQIANDPSFPQPAGPSSTNAAGVLASEIATARGVSRPNISALVGVLLRKGLVRQFEDAGDRRRKYLSITAKGVRSLQHVEPERRRVNASLFADFSTAEKELVLDFLKRCLANLWYPDGNGEK